MIIFNKTNKQSYTEIYRVYRESFVKIPSMYNTFETVLFVNNNLNSF